MTTRSQRSWRGRLTAVLVTVSVAATGFVGLSTVGVDGANAAETAPAADLLDVDFGDGTPADASASQRAATTIGTPVYATDAELGRSLPSFNEDAGAGNGTPESGDADGYTYDIADAYAAGTLQDGFTFQCVFRTNTASATAGENEICGDKYAGGFGLYLSAATLTLQATVHDGGYRSASVALRGNTWYDVVQVWDGSTISLYLDGMLVATRTDVTSMTPPAASRQVVALGGSPSSATDLNYRGQITMAGARLWSEPLTADQVAALAVDAEVTPAISNIDPMRAAAPPVLAGGKTWPADVPEANLLDVNFADGDVVDTASGATGTVARNAGSSTPTIANDDTLDQQVATFDGTHGYAYTTNAWASYSDVMTDNVISFECVFKLDSSVTAGHYSYPCGQLYSGGAGLYTSAYSAGAKTATVQARINNGSYVGPSATVKTDTWYDAVQVWDGENVRLYLNGELAGLTNLAGSTLRRPTYDFLTIGGAAKSASSLNTTDLNSLWGSVATARAWAEPLTEPEIQALYELSGVPEVDDDGGTPVGVKVPQADVLDVTMLHGSPVDRVSGEAPHIFGKPAKSFEETLNRSVATFDGVGDAYAYDLTKAWNPGRTPNVTGGFTIECYFRSNGTAGVLQKVCSGEESGGFSVQVPANSDNTVKAEAHIGGGYKSLSAAITPGAWNHVVFTFDGTAEKLYVNGVLKAFAGISGKVSPPGGTGFLLGADTGGSYPTAQSWAQASVAISRIWSKALNDEQVAKLYAKDTSTTAVPSADVLDVDFHDGSYADHSPNALVPEEYGVPQIVTDPTLDRPVASFDGDGSAQVYDITEMWNPDHTPNITSAFTIQCDFRYDGTLPTPAEMNVCSGKEGGGYSVNVNGNSAKIRTCVGDDGSNCRSLSTPIEAGVWNALVATWDSATSEYNLYLNGQLVSGGFLSGVGDDPNASPMVWVLGADANGLGQPAAPAPATIAEARMWSTALTSEQVSALYQDDFGQAHTDIALTSTSPAAGEHITKAQELKVAIRNKDQATGWTYEIDGVQMQPGSTVGAGLASGDHLLRISAIDAFGVPVEFTVPFTSANIPGTANTNVGQGGGKVTLSATPTSPAGGDITTTFKVAEASVADGGETGAIPALPATLDFSSTDTATLSGEQAFDGAESDSVSEHHLLPYQRFDVGVPEGGARHVRWTGTVDPQRSVTLYAWDTVDLAWQEIAGARGNAGGQTMLDGEVRDSMVDRTVNVAAPNVGAVHLLAVASDPFADDLSPRDGSNANEEFGDPDSYDFSFVHWTDPQFIAEGAAGGSGHYPSSPTYETAQGDNAMRPTQAEQKIWASAYESAAEWTVDNAEARKIAWATNTGDIINNNLVDPADPSNLAVYGPAAAGDSNKLGQPYSELKDQTDRENAAAVKAFEKIWNWRDSNGNGLVSQVVAGNHDNRRGLDAKTSPTDPTNPAAQSTTADDFYNEAFTAETYYDQAAEWPAGASYHTIDETTDADGKVVTRGTDNQNNYVLFSAGGQDFVAVGLSYGVTVAEADWASSIFRRYHDRNGILITHGYLSSSSNPDGRTAGKSSDGSRLYTKVVTANPNVFLVLAGHVHGVGTNLVHVKDKTATITHKTVELLADYQAYEVPASKIFTRARCQAAGLSDVYDPATKTGSKCKPLGDNTIDVDGDGTADHNDDDLLSFGASFLRLLQFDTDASTMTVHSYSPFLDEFGAHEYDEPKHRYNGSEDAFTVPVDLQSRMTSFSTDGIAVLTPSDTVIGTATSKSGRAASVTWEGLTAGEIYAWTATSEAANGDEVGTVEQFGGLFVATKAGTDSTAPVLHVPANKEITVGAGFDALAGASATDNADGDLTAQITVTGSVDTSTPGVYPLLYAVADDNGNTAQAQRVITVKAVPEPVRTATAVSVGNHTVTFGKEATLTATVTPAVAGTMVFSNGEDAICTVTVSAGRATCATPNFGGVGGESYLASATFYPADDSAYEMSAKAFVLKIQAPAGVDPGAGHVKAKAGKPTFKVAKAPTSKKKGRAVVRVAPDATGKVKVRLVKGAKHKTLKVRLDAGKGTVKLPKLAKGVWKVRLTYLGNSDLRRSVAKTKLKVRR